MSILKGKIIGFGTFRNTFAENFDRQSDIVLSLTLPVPSETIKPGNVIKISGFPDNTLRNLQNMNGFFPIDDVAVVSDKVYVYLTTGKATWKGDTKDYTYTVRQADYEIDTAVTTKLSNIGGWTKTAKSATDAMAQAAGKIENCRRIYKWIKNEIEPTANILIKETWRMQDFKNIIGDMNAWMNKSEAFYNQSAGLRATNNPYYKQFELEKISNIYKFNAESLKACEEDFLNKEKKIKDWMKITGMEKAWQGTKTATLAPLRGFIKEILIGKNMARFGESMYAMKKDSPAKYEEFRSHWYGLGGNRTEIDKEVEKQKKNYDKRYVDGSNASGGYNAEGEDTTAATQTTADASLAALNETAATGTIKLPVGVGAAVAGAVTGATSGAAAPYAVPIAVAWEVGVTLVNNAGLKVKKVNKDVPVDEILAPEAPTETPGMSPIAKNLLIGGGIFAALAVAGYIFREPIKKIFKKK